jgi:hypothetical protein
MVAFRRMHSTIGFTLHEQLLEGVVTVTPSATDRNRCQRKKTIWFGTMYQILRRRRCRMDSLRDIRIIGVEWYILNESLIRSVLQGEITGM